MTARFHLASRTASIPGVLVLLAASLAAGAPSVRAQGAPVDTVVAYTTTVRAVAVDASGGTFAMAGSGLGLILNGVPTAFSCGLVLFDTAPLVPRLLACVVGPTTALVARDGSALLVGGSSFMSTDGAATPLMAKLELPLGRPTAWRLSPNPSTRLPTVIDRMVEPAAGIVFASGRDQATNESVILRVDIATGAAATILVVPGTISALAISSDGGVFVGGDFTIAVAGRERRGLLKLQAGSWQVDPDYADGPGAALTAVAGAADGAAYVARGDVPGAVRVGASGMVDDGWTVSADGVVQAIATDAAHRVYLAGAFSSVNGVPRSRVARVSPVAGAMVDAGWVPEPVTGTVIGMQVDSDSVTMNGAITAAQSHQAGVVRLSVATATPPEAAARIRIGDTYVSGNTRTVTRVFPTGDGDLIVVGPFTMTGRNVVPGVVRIDRFGNERAAWAPALRGRVRAGVAGGDGSLFLSGFLARTSDPQALWQVVRVTGPDAAIDPEWNAVMETGPADALAVDAPWLYLLGWFTSINGTPAVLASRMSLAAPAAVDPAFAPDFPCCILLDFRTIQPQADGSALLNFAAGGTIGFEPPPPPGPPIQPLRRLQPQPGGPSTLVNYGPLLDSSLRDVQNVMVDGRGDRYLLGRLRVSADPSRLGIVRMLADGSFDPSMANFSAECRPYGPGAVGTDGLVYLACEEPGSGSPPRRRVVRLVPGSGDIDRDWTADAPLLSFYPPTHLAAAGDRLVVVLEDAQGGPLRLYSFSTVAQPLFADGMEPVANP